MRLSGNLFQMFAYACTIASLWQAPIPWLHLHADAAQRSDALVTHLDAYHRCAPFSAEWHLHFVLLNEVLHGGGCPVPVDEESRDREWADVVVLPTETSSVLDQSPVSVAFDLAPLNDTPELHTAVSADTHFRPRHPLSRHSLDGTLLSLICVALC